MNKTHVIILLLLALLSWSCDPNAYWVNDESLKVQMTVETVSAGFVECSFSTDKEAYYLISIEKVSGDYDPLTHQKQFMMLALDSANLKYLAWRNRLLKEGEFNIAPFSSHSLKYGPTKHFFTALTPETDYWVFAFAVNPETLQPISTLTIQKVRTTAESVIDAHFEYRVKGVWDYIYPVDSKGNILANFPYIATTRDSAELEGDPKYAPYIFFIEWTYMMHEEPEMAKIRYGVQVVENDGLDSYLEFEENHTYYTFISSYDGYMTDSTIYRFVWQGDSTNYYFVDTDPANIINAIDELDL